MTLSGHTVPYAVLGHPIGHTLSPIMHNESFKALGLDAVYLAFDVAPERLLEVLPSMRDMGFGGVNLTVPLKEVAFNGLPDLADSASRLGAVNTVEFLEDGGIRGHNTDGDGFRLAVEEEFKREIAGMKVFVLGSGGAGRAVALTCAALGASRVAVTDVDSERPGRLSAEIKETAPSADAAAVDADPAAWKEASLDADLVVQATPVGMKEEDTPLLGPDAFRSGQMLFDLVYMYPETGIMKAAIAAGASAANGLGMLMHQGAHAFKIWSGTDAETTVMRKALESEVY